MGFGKMVWCEFSRCCKECPLANQIAKKYLFSILLRFTTAGLLWLFFCLFHLRHLLDDDDLIFGNMFKSNFFIAQFTDQSIFILM